MLNNAESLTFGSLTTSRSSAHLLGIGSMGCIAVGLHLPLG